MSSTDEFAASLLEEAKRFLERAQMANGGSGELPNLHAALMMAFCSLEAHVNAVADEMAQRPDLTPHELGILLEKKVSLVRGEFVKKDELQIFRLEDRLEFLHARFGMKPDPSGPWRGPYANAANLRNELTHPKGVPTMTLAGVKRALEAVIETIDALYRAVYDRPFPASTWQLKSRIDF